MKNKHMKTLALFLVLLSTTIFGAETKAVKLRTEPCCAKHLPRKSSGSFGAQRLAGDIRTFWPQNYKLSVHFLDGTTRQKAAAWKRFGQIDKLVNLSFEKSDSPKAHIRVSFSPDKGHWSYMGKEALEIKSPAPTMNLALKAGILGDGSWEWDRVVLHEVGHAIGMIHEHSNPLGGVQWNVPYVLQYYKTTQGWSEQEVYQQVLFKYNINHLRATEADPKSIMMYPIPFEHTTNRYYVGWNDKLSPTDIWFFGQIYPNKGAPFSTQPLVR